MTFRSKQDRWLVYIIRQQVWPIADLETRIRVVSLYCAPCIQHYNHKLVLKIVKDIILEDLSWSEHMWNPCIHRFYRGSIYAAIKYACNRYLYNVVPIMLCTNEQIENDIARPQCVGICITETQSLATFSSGSLLHGMW